MIEPTSAEPAAQGFPVRVLIIEDERETADHIADGLDRAGCSVQAVYDGASGLDQALKTAFDVIIVDRMLPHLDGLSLVRQLRSAQVQTPVLFVTAMGAVADRVSGLEQGGDDYLVKPFSFAELNARVGALARRAPAPLRERTVLQCGDVILKRLDRTARRQGVDLALLPLEYRLLEYLMLHADRVVTRTMLLENVWGFHFDPRTNIVETHISRLRGKIDLAGAPPLITTLRGVGYVIRTGQS